MDPIPPTQVPPTQVPPIPRPVLPFEYTEPHALIPRRPGFVTAIGVTSIVVASLSILANVFAGAYSVGMTVVNAARASMATAVMTAQAQQQAAADQAAAAQAAADAGEFPPGPRGLVRTEREQIARVLATIRPLNPEKHARLHQLLAKCGQDVFPFVRSTTTSSDATIRNNVSESGQLPSVRGGDDGPVYFIVGTGKLEIDDDKAAFFPTGGGSAARVARGVIDPDSSMLSSSDIDAVIARVNTICAGSGSITPAQTQTLRLALTGADQRLISIGPHEPPAAQQVVAAMVMPQGQLTVRTSGSFLSIDSAGNIIGRSGMPFMGPTINVRKSASTLTILEALGSGLLAIYLLVIGILMLRQVRASRRLHLIYAALKIPLAIVMAVGWAWFIADVSSSGAQASNAGVAITIWMTIAGTVSGAYAIVLLFALNTRHAKEYFNPRFG
jgi:hypothetical protein